MSVRTEVVTQFAQIAEEQNRSLALLTDDLPLIESGLNSLCFAVIVARLEDLLGIDPFSAASEAPFPVTLGEFVAAYENAAS